MTHTVWLTDLYLQDLYHTAGLMRVGTQQLVRGRCDHGPIGRLLGEHLEAYPTNPPGLPCTWGVESLQVDPSSRVRPHPSTAARTGGTGCNLHLEDLTLGAVWGTEPKGAERCRVTPNVDERGWNGTYRTLFGCICDVTGGTVAPEVV